MGSLLLTCVTTGLPLLSVWFWSGETSRGRQWTPALTLPQVRYGLSMLLIEVFCTLSVPSICRHVHRQLVRNELARFWDCLTPQLVELTVFALIPWGPSGAMYTNQPGAVSAQVTHKDKPLCASHGERHDNSNTAV